MARKAETWEELFSCCVYSSLYRKGRGIYRVLKFCIGIIRRVFFLKIYPLKNCLARKAETCGEASSCYVNSSLHRKGSGNDRGWIWHWKKYRKFFKSLLKVKKHPQVASGTYILLVYTSLVAWIQSLMKSWFPGEGLGHNEGGVEFLHGYKKN